MTVELLSSSAKCKKYQYTHCIHICTYEENYMKQETLAAVLAVHGPPCHYPNSYYPFLGHLQNSSPHHSPKEQRDKSKPIQPLQQAPPDEEGMPSRPRATPRPHGMPYATPSVAFPYPCATEDSE